MIRLARLSEAQWPVLKATRLSALADAPHAFTGRYEQELLYRDERWRQMAADNASDERSAGFIAYDADSPVGLVACPWQDRPRGLVRLVSLWVAPQARRLGVASALVDSALGWARIVGALDCETEVTDENHAAEVFYWRRGFRRVRNHAPTRGTSRWLRNVRAAPTAAWNGEEEAVRLVESDPSWLAKFEEERKLLASALEPWLDGAVEHVGSTAVPGMAAKPIVDMMAAVSSLEDACAAIPVLEALGYCYAPDRPRRHWFCKPSPARREFHLILLERSDPEWERRIAFRNLLRSDPARARAYLELKREAARQHANDREAYTDAKARFVETATAEALGSK